MEEPLMRTILRTNKQWTLYRRKISQELGIPDSYRMILMYLNKHPGASQKEIAEFRDITTSSVNQTVKEMLLTGYLEKQTSEEDLRCSKLYLTEKGVQCATQIRQRIEEAEEKVARFITPEKKTEIIELLTALSNQIQRGFPDC